MSIGKVSKERLIICYGILLIAGLSSCAGVLTSEPASAEPEHTPVPIIVEIPQGTVRELFRDGVDALQHDDGVKAKSLFQQVLVLEPNHKLAPGLLSQIDANPVEMLGKENFLYKVQPGDTLSIISRRFLGDPLKFYILARYNGIVISNNLEAGRFIKIPGKTPPPTKVVPEEKPTPQDTSNLRLSEAKTLSRDGKYADAINVLERARSEGGATAELDDLLVKAYAEYAKILTDSGQLEDASKLLSKGLSAYPTSERMRKQNDQIDVYYNAEQAYKEGNQWLNTGQPVKAYTAFVKILKLVPEHTGAKAALATIKPQVVEAYYADSVRARRRQNFTEAINSLDRLLEIDPNHELAKSSRIEIKAILDRERSGK